MYDRLKKKGFFFAECVTIFLMSLSSQFIFSRCSSIIAVVPKLFSCCHPLVHQNTTLTNPPPKCIVNLWLDLLGVSVACQISIVVYPIIFFLYINGIHGKGKSRHTSSTMCVARAMVQMCHCHHMAAHFFSPTPGPFPGFGCGTVHFGNHCTINEPTRATELV